MEGKSFARKPEGSWKVVSHRKTDGMLRQICSGELTAPIQPRSLASTNLNFLESFCFQYKILSKHIPFHSQAPQCKLDCVCLVLGLHNVDCHQMNPIVHLEKGHGGQLQL